MLAWAVQLPQEVESRDDTVIQVDKLSSDSLNWSIPICMPHLAIRDALETTPSGGLLCRRPLHFHPRLSLEPAFDP
jgi:hypothetical protein